MVVQWQLICESGVVIEADGAILHVFSANLGHVEAAKHRTVHNITAKCSALGLVLHAFFEVLVWQGSIGHSNIGNHTMTVDAILVNPSHKIAYGKHSYIVLRRGTLTTRVWYDKGPFEFEGKDYSFHCCVEAESISITDSLYIIKTVAGKILLIDKDKIIQRRKKRGRNNRSVWGAWVG